MTNINVGWADIKSFVNDRKLSIQWVVANNTYYLVAFDGPFSLSCQILMDGTQASDQTDFETNFKPTGNASPRANVVQVLGADTLVLNPFGALLNPNANASTTCDIVLPETLVLKGGILFSNDAVIGDYISISIIDKDNVLGAGGTSDNPIVLGAYVQSWYVMPGQQNILEDVSISQTLPKGVYMRVIYNSVGQTAPHVIMNCIAYTGKP